MIVIANNHSSQQLNDAENTNSKFFACNFSTDGQDPLSQLLYGFIVSYGGRSSPSCIPRTKTQSMTQKSRWQKYESVRGWSLVIGSFEFIIDKISYSLLTYQCLPSVFTNYMYLKMHVFSEHILIIICRRRMTAIEILQRNSATNTTFVNDREICRRMLPASHLFRRDNCACWQFNQAKNTTQWHW